MRSTWCKFLNGSCSLSEALSTIDGDATMDWPMSMSYKDAKSEHLNSTLFILTTRDSPDQWARSYFKLQGPNALFSAARFGPEAKRRSSLKFWLWVSFFQLLGVDAISLYECQKTALAQLDGCAREGRLTIDAQFERKCSKAYSAYSRDVQQHVPEDRLLVFNVRQGWAPLCKFLKLPIPNTPFPHVDSVAESNPDQILHGTLLVVGGIVVTCYLVIVGNMNQRKYAQTRSKSKQA